MSQMHGGVGRWNIMELSIVLNRSPPCHHWRGAYGSPNFVRRYCTIEEVYKEVKKIRADMVRREDLEALADTARDPE